MLSFRKAHEPQSNNEELVDTYVQLARRKTMFVEHLTFRMHLVSNAMYSSQYLLGVPVVTSWCVCESMLHLTASSFE